MRTGETIDPACTLACQRSQEAQLHKSERFLLSTTARELYYFDLKSCCNLLKIDRRKLSGGPDIVLALLIVMFAIGIPVASFLMNLLLACSKMPIFPREVKRGDVLKQS